MSRLCGGISFTVAPFPALYFPQDVRYGELDWMPGKKENELPLAVVSFLFLPFFARDESRRPAS